MAKVNIKNIPNVERLILKTFKDVKNNKEMLQEIGDFSVGRIRGRVRQGKPLNDTGRFPSLTEVTKRIRKFLEGLNATHPTYKASRSNVTFTGQLVDAIDYLIKRRSVVEISVKDTKRSAIIGRNGPIKNTKTNLDVANDLADRGFVLFTADGLRSDENYLKRINKIVNKFIRKSIRFNFES